MIKLGVVVTSTRPHRVGEAVARWFAAKARAHGAFDVAWVDLKALALPALDEPNHPRLGKYEHAHTQAWSATVSGLDAFAFVTPEYNYGMPPALLNALNYLFHEWAYKAAAFVSYGGISGGTRSVQMSKQVLTSLKMMPIPEGVFIPFVNKLIQPDGTFDPGPTQDERVKATLDELAKWSVALKTLRT